MINYSIHTYELSMNVSSDEYHSIYQYLSSLHSSEEKKTYETSKTQILSYFFRKLPFYGINGIILKTIKLVEDNIFIYKIYIIINLYNALLSYNQSNECIIKPEQISDALKIIDRQLTHILPAQITKQLSLNRIDFCLNLPFKNQQQAEEYIQLLRLGIPPKALKAIKTLDVNQHRKLPYKDSLFLQCGCYSFEIYPKYIQMKNRNLNHAEQALGVVRIELRAKKQKIMQLAKKYSLPLPSLDYHTFIKNSPLITQPEITSILSKMVGNQDFHNFAYTKSKILQSNFKASKKQQMNEIIKYFSRRKFNEDFFDTFGINHKEWKKILKNFNLIGCSPITVSPSYSMDTFPGIGSWDSYFE